MVLGVFLRPSVRRPHPASETAVNSDASLRTEVTVGSDCSQEGPKWPREALQQPPAFQQQGDKYEHPRVQGSSSFLSCEPPARLPASSLTRPSTFTPCRLRLRLSVCPKSVCVRVCECRRPPAPSSLPAPLSVTPAQTRIASMAPLSGRWTSACLRTPQTAKVRRVQGPSLRPCCNF